MKKIFKYLRARDWLFILCSLGLITAQVWLDLTMPDYTAKLTTVISSRTATMQDVWQNGGMMLLCALGSMVCAIICTFFCAQVAASYAKTLRLALFPHILHFSNKEINRFSVPSLITRTTNDVVQMQMFLAMGLQILFKAPILAIWAVCKISTSSAEWTAATVLCVVILVIFVGILVALCYPRFKKIQKLTDDLNDSMRENITGVRVVRAFNAEQYQENKFAAVNTAVYKNNIFTSRTMGLMMPVMMLMMNGLTLAIYWIGAYLINDAVLTARPALMGSMTAFVAYALQVVMAFMMLIAIFIILPRTMVSSKRISEVLDTESCITDPRSPDLTPTPRRGEVVFQNVSFSYNDADHPALKDISFRVNPGETVAIIGATGSGKTTLVNLLSRFYDVTAGQILVDGRDVRDYSLADLRDRISHAMQKAVLFKGTVRSNLCYGVNRDKSDEALLQALRIACADFVTEAPEGLALPVAQGGANFSGGQKQRLSIARALCKESDILVFDDSFSALDYKTDLLVRKGIRETTHATVFLIAQRIGTVKNADKIIVLDDGGIAGIGTHRELLQTNEVYRDIALSQLSKEELEVEEER